MGMWPLKGGGTDVAMPASVCQRHYTNTQCCLRVLSSASLKGCCCARYVQPRSWDVDKEPYMCVCECEEM
jgi:hypothetical protein